MLLPAAARTALAACAAVHVFGVPNVVYMQAAAALPGGAVVSFLLENLVSPAYSAPTTQNGAQVSGAALRARKIDAQYAFYVQRVVAACTAFQQALATVSDATGNANGVTYEISFVTGHDVPAGGAVTITFPDAYPGDMLTMAQADGTRVACSASSRAAAPLCRVGDTHRIDLFGAEFAPTALYQVAITGLNNPPQSAGLQLVITSLYDANVYLAREICTATFAYPLIAQQPVRTCLIAPDAQLRDAGSLPSLHTFTLQCQDDVRAGSQVQILLPSAYAGANAPTTSLACASLEGTTLASSAC